MSFHTRLFMFFLISEFSVYLSINSSVINILDLLIKLDFNKNKSRERIQKHHQNTVLPLKKRKIKEKISIKYLDLLVKISWPSSFLACVFLVKISW